MKAKQGCVLLLVCSGLMQIAALGTAMEFTAWSGIGPGCADGTGTVARLFSPMKVAKDSAGNFYISDSGNHTIRKMTAAGVVSTLAGLAGVSGNVNGTGAVARFGCPTGLAVDTSNNVFVVDRENCNIRKITPAGVVTTLAGGGYGTNDGTGLAAQFKSPYGLGLDVANNLFVADTYNHTIRKVTPAGVVTTLAGGIGSSGTNDGIRLAARFYCPYDLVVDSDGMIYVADGNNNSIRRVTPNGVVTTFAGLSGDRGAIDAVGAAARFNFPMGVAVDTGHNLYISDMGNAKIRKITSAASVSTLAGSVAGYKDTVSTSAQFAYPFGLVTDAGTNVLVADMSNHVIRKISPGNRVTTMAGKGPGHEDGGHQVARFWYPCGVAVDTNANVYVSDTFNHTIRKITPDGTVSTFAGAAGVSGTNDGVSGSARFFQPSGLAVDAANNLYVADEDNHLIRKITPAGVVSTVAGVPGDYSGTNDGPCATAHFNFPRALAFDGAGVMYVADTMNHTIRRISGGQVTTYAGVPGSSGTNNGARLAAQFDHPVGVAVNDQGTVYVSDMVNLCIRKITAAGTVSTLAGLPNASGSADGTGTLARFTYPMSLALDSTGNLYVADDYLVRKVTPAGVVTTLGGRTVTGYAEGLGASASFNALRGLAVDRLGNLYLTDTQNNHIRRGTWQLPQLIFQDNSGQLAGWVLTTNSALQSTRLLANTGGWKLKAAGDVDGDGISDLCFQTAAGDVACWFMHTDGTPRTSRALGNSGVWELKGCGDYDGAGRSQLFFQSLAGDVAYWQFSDAMVATNSVVLGNQGDWKLKAVGDLDRDGKAELFWKNSAGSVAIWFHDGVGGAIRSFVMGQPNAWALCGAVDVDENGTTDLVWQAPDGTVACWLMQTNGTATGVGVIGTAAGWRLNSVGK